MFFEEKSNARMEVFKRVAKTLEQVDLFNEFVTQDILKNSESIEVLDIEDDRDLEEKLKDFPLWQQENIRQRFKEADTFLNNPDYKYGQEEELFLEESRSMIKRSLEIAKLFWHVKYLANEFLYKDSANFKIAKQAYNIARRKCRDDTRNNAAFRVVAFNAYADCYSDMGQELAAQELREKAKEVWSHHNIEP